MNINSTCYLLKRAVLLLIILSLNSIASCIPAYAETTPQLIITQPPIFKQRYCNMQGTVSGVNPADYYIAAIIFIPGVGWYSKPYCSDAGRVVNISPDGKWSVNTYTGGNSSLDNLATMVEAYLIPKTSYPECFPECVTAAHCAPASLVASSVASDRALCPGQRTISWSGYEWHVRTSQGGGNSGQVGHAYNYFSDSSNNVWVDAEGRLHLKITYANGHWNSAWIASTTRLGYGTYRFYCDSRLDNLDKFVTLGMFTWTDLACVEGNREIDLEFSTWGDSILPNNAQYVIQPYWVNGNLSRYQLTSAATSTHSFTWQPDSVSFSSVEGHCAPPSSCTPINSWEFTRLNGVHSSADERVHLNLWLNNGSYNNIPAPSSGQPVEVVISKFEFIPYKDPSRPLVGINSRDIGASVTTLASDKYKFRLWGRVTSKNSSGFLLSDGGPATRILDPGHTFATDSILTADGILSSTNPKLLDTATGRIELIR